MQIIPTLPIRALGPNDPTQELRPFQRVTAAVLQVSPTRAVLSIGGYPVVAEISSNEVATALKGRSLAQFIVSQAEDGRIVLRLAGEPGASTADPQPAAGQSLAARLLDAFELAPTAANLTAAQAALNQRLDLQPGQVEAMLQTLGSMPGWGSNEADLAAALLAGGLPLTPQSLALMARPTGQVGQGLAEMLAQLNAALQDGSLPAEFKQQLQNVYQLLQEAVLDPGSPKSFSQKLAAAIRLLGRPLENQLVQEDGSLPAGRSLAALVQLRQEAARLGLKDLADQAEDFWKDLSQAQFLNLPGNSARGEEWLKATFLMRLPAPPQVDQDTAPVRLLVSRQPAGQPGALDPDKAHVILQVDLSDQQVIQVEIALDHYRVQAEVTLPDAVLYDAACLELPALQERLSDLGFSLSEAHLAVGSPVKIIDKLPVLPSGGVILTAIDLEA